MSAREENRQLECYYTGDKYEPADEIVELWNAPESPNVLRGFGFEIVRVPANSPVGILTFPAFISVGI